MRGLPRLVAVLAVVAVVAVVCAFTLRRAFTPSAFLIEAVPLTLPADGFTSTEIKVHSSTGRALRGLHVEVDDPHRAAVDSVVVDRDTAVISLHAGVLPGEAKIQLAAPGFVSREVVLHTTLDVSDSVGDGTPDFLRLHDAAH